MVNRAPSRGFTLIELLMVMAIIGILIGLLIPVMNSSLTLVRKYQTQRIIRDITFGIENFHQDFNVYPPSKPSTDPTKPVANGGAMNSGAANIVFYLRGPGGMGWGTGAAGALPFKGTPTRAYGPYYDTTEDMFTTRQNPVNPSAYPFPVGFLDGFRPAGTILYFRSEPPTGGVTATHPANEDFDVTDNNLPAADTTKPQFNYASATGQTQRQAFNDVNAYYATKADGTQIIDPSTGQQAVQHYKRPHYMLVSPGADGCYGFVKLNPNSTNPKDDYIPAPGGIGALPMDDIQN